MRPLRPHTWADITNIACMGLPDYIMTLITNIKHRKPGPHHPDLPQTHHHSTNLGGGRRPNPLVSTFPRSYWMQKFKTAARGQRTYIVRDLQFYHFYYPSEYQHGHIGYFHPPAEFKEFDEENVWQFFMTNPLDLP